MHIHDILWWMGTTMEEAKGEFGTRPTNWDARRRLVLQHIVDLDISTTEETIEVYQASIPTRGVHRDQMWRHSKKLTTSSIPPEIKYTCFFVILCIDIISP